MGLSHRNIRRRMQIPFDTKGVSRWAQPAENVIAPKGLPSDSVCAVPWGTAIKGT